MTVGERIRERRKELGYSVEELAAKLHKNRSTVYRYENGSIDDMPTQVLEEVAKVLETTPAELMGWKSEADRFEATADAFNKAHPGLPTMREKNLLLNYRKLNDGNKDRVDRLTQTLLDAQDAEDDILLAAHREREFDQEAHDHDMEILKNL